MSDPRTRAVIGVSLAIVAAVVAIALILGPGEDPPATGAAGLVPGDALVYVHLSTDRRRPAVKGALSLANRFPDYPALTGTVEARLSALLNAPGTRVGAWLGNEAAFALLNTPGSSAGSLIVLDVARPQLARQLVAAGDAASDGTYRATPLLRNRSGTELAFVSHYLVLGQATSVRAAIDVAAGQTRALTQMPAYKQAAENEPADRVLDAYASVAGVRRVLEPRRGPLGALGVVLDQPALTATTISLSATSPGARVAVHSALDSTLARVSAAPAEGFEPNLPSVLPAPGVLALDVKDLFRWGPRILGATAKAGVGAGVQPLFARLAAALASEGVDVHSLSTVFAGESAVAISPTAVTSSPLRGPAAGGQVSARGAALVVLTRTSHQQATSEMLASLEGPLAQLFPPPASGPGQAPEFTEVPLSGVTVHQLHLAPGLELDYAVFRGLVVISTSLPAMAEVINRRHSLQDERGYALTLADRPDQVTSLLFLDFSQLLSLGEQTGLIGGRHLSALRPDLEKIKSISLTSSRQEADTDGELILNIP